MSETIVEKAEECLLLGAGASVKAGIPHAYAMTDRIIARLTPPYPTSPDYSKVLNFVVGGLLLQAGCRGENPLRSGVNVEDLFNAVQLLARRHELEAAPFIGSWHALVDELDRIDPPEPRFDRVHRAIYKSVSGQVAKAVSQRPSSFDERELDSALSSSVVKIVESAIRSRSVSSSSLSFGKSVSKFLEKLVHDWKRELAHSPSGSEVTHELERSINRDSSPGEGTVFDETNRAMIATLIAITWIRDVEKVRYLHPIIDLCRSQGRLMIATLNYDNAVELANSSHPDPVQINNGLLEWATKSSFDLPRQGISLLKMHGSIDWQFTTHKASGYLSHKIVEPVSDEVREKEEYDPAVIFGQRNKLTADGPFLALLRAFEQGLENSQRVTVIGYSFRDDHVNVYLRNWMNRDLTRRIRVVSPDFEFSANAFTRQLSSLKDRVEIVKSTAEESLPNLFTATN